MKLIKGIVLFAFFSVLIHLSSCFEEPQFSIIPQISFNNIRFNGTDSLIVSISFKDGDGNIGLGAQEDNPPFNPRTYFLVNNGQLTPVGLTRRSESLPLVIDVPPGATGKLATSRSRNLPGNGNLPPLSGNATCDPFYGTDMLVLPITNSAVIDNSYNIVDTIRNVNPHLIRLNDTFYFEPNRFHHNLTIQFFIRNPNGTFTEYDWWNERCTTFNGRIGALSERDRPLDGNLYYSMVSAGFSSVFGGRTLKLRIQLRDRTLNESNIIETPEFTLQSITRR